MECSKEDIIVFNRFDVVPVRCDISYFLSEEMEVDETFYVDSISLDNSGDMITFDLANNTQEMIEIKDIISLDVTKISKKEYLQAIKDDKDFFNLLD